MAEIAWNTNELETLARNINNCRNALQTQQRRLIQLSRETQDGWKSDAGNLYATRLNEDIQELNRTIQALSTAITRLREAKGIYQNGEEQMYGVLRRALAGM
mgnify:FL=1